MSEKTVTLAGDRLELKLERDGNTFRYGEHEIEILSIHGPLAEIRIAGRTQVVPFVIRETTVSFSFDGEIYSAEVSDRSAPGKARHRDQSLSAPMPGLVLKLLVEKGASVEKGAPLVILEAMKMEHTIVAPRDGTVVAVNCREGEMVQPGIDLVELTKEI